MTQSYGAVGEDETVSLISSHVDEEKRPGDYRSTFTKSYAWGSILYLVVGAFILSMTITSFGHTLLAKRTGVESAPSKVSKARSNADSEISENIVSYTSSVTIQTVLGIDYEPFSYRDHIDELNFDLDGSTQTSTDSSQQPNIVFILVDDVGYNDISYESDDFQDVMPTIDKLVDTGVRLRNYYTEYLCTPARAALMTGQYSFNNGMQKKILYDTSLYGLPLDLKLMPDYFREGGYETHLVGKWHLGAYHRKYLPNHRGFDTSFGYLNGEEDYYSHKLYDNVAFTNVTDLIFTNKSGHYPVVGADGFYSASLYTERAVSVIDGATENGNPFFLYLALQNSHYPSIDPPPYYFTDAELKPTGTLGEKTFPSPLRRTYAKMMNAADKSVLRILHALHRNDQLQDTIVVFASDNGGCRQAGSLNNPYRGGKGKMWEGGVKVASFVFAPSFMSAEVIGGEYEGLFHVTDWMPTLLAAVGLGPTATGGTNGANEEEWEEEEEGESYWSNPIDGVSQWAVMTTDLKPAEAPRVSAVLHFDVLQDDMAGFLPNNTKLLAFRYDQYKLMLLQEQAPVYTVADLDRMVESRATEQGNLTGGYCSDPDLYSEIAGMPARHEFLFDLRLDPYESSNLAELPEYDSIKAWVYTKFTSIVNRAQIPAYTAEYPDQCALKVWEVAGNFYVPWLDHLFTPGNASWTNTTC